MNQHFYDRQGLSFQEMSESPAGFGVWIDAGFAEQQRV